MTHFTGLQPGGALALPMAFGLALVACDLLPSAQRNPALAWSFWGAAGLLLAWSGGLLVTARRRGRAFTLEVVPRRQHYLQACAQLGVYVYWGWYWRPVYEYADLIVAQLIFAYAFDALLTWSRRSTYKLGFGPLPIILSTNLFLWFKPEWFFFQFLLVAVGFAAKELIRWEKDGQRVHVFNPSSFPLALFSVILLVTGTTHLTWGVDIAYTQLYPPYIYLWIFLISLPGQYFFGVTLMTLSAVVTACLFIFGYAAVTGTGFFFGNYLPVATFLGMHLLFNDPSTSPRTALGRILFGMLYAASVLVLYALLDSAGTPTFYDKLLAVPVLNLMIQGIDRLARSSALKHLDPTVLVAALAPRRRNLATMSVWAVLFVMMQSFTSRDQDLGRHDKQGVAFFLEGRIPEAISQFSEAAKLAPEYFLAHKNLGVAFMQAGQPGNAVDAFRGALELEPESAEAQQMLASALSESGQPRAAIEHFREAVRLEPDRPAALTALAWLRATHSAADVRDPEEAMRLAARAAELTGGSDPQVLDTLAAAQASAGQFDEAVQTAKRAERLYQAAVAPHRAEQVRSRISLYRVGRSLVLPGPGSQLP